MASTVYCLAPGCKNNSKVTHGIFYHRIKDDYKWHNFCSLNRNNLFSTKLCERPELALCSAHFRPEDYRASEDHVLLDDSVPTVSTAFEETKDMCYLCFSTSATTNLVDIEPEALRELESLHISLLQTTKVPSKMCDGCSNEIHKVVTFASRIKSANDFWRRFAYNIGQISTIKKSDSNVTGLVGNQGDLNFDCNECDYKTSDKDTLFRHVWRAHALNPDDPTTCSICNKQLKAEAYNRKHFMVCHYDGIEHENLICSECGFIAKTSQHMAFHLKTNHDIINQQRVRCEWCLLSFIDNARLEAHMAVRHPEKLQPAQPPVIQYEVKVLNEKPPENLMDDDSMDVDESSWNDNDPKAEDDDDDDEEEDNLPLTTKIKMKKEPEVASTSPLVEIPSKKEKKKDRRSTTVQDDVTHKCPDCDVEISGKTSMALGGLRRHYWVRHARIPESPNACRTCKKKFNTEHTCRMHYFNHHFDTSYTCDICGMTGFTKLKLGIHTNYYHKGKPKPVWPKKPLACRFCARRFNTMQEKEQHEDDHEKHEQSKPFVCNECGKCYTTSYTLKHHMDTHLDKRSHSCDICNRKFNTAQNLRAHKLTHSVIAPFRCALCHKEYNQSGNIKTHILKVHGSYDNEYMDSEIIIRNSTAPPKGKGKGRKKGQKEREEIIVGDSEYE